MKRLTAIFLLMGMLVLVAGCDKIGWKAKSDVAGADLLYVEIVFDNGEKLNTYVKELGVGKDSTIYAGGISDSSMYDASGNLVGNFNYNRVHYMKVLAPAPK
ncbi:MAG: hypothetical protein ACM3NT_11865 [Methylocystaceae bacterium]